MTNYISQVTLPSGSGYDIRELFPHIGDCTVAASAAAKTVTIGNFKLYTGAWVVVKFSNTNSADVASLTLNVDGTGAKPIKYRNANLSSAGLLIANRYTYFVYDGTNYQIVGDFDTNSDTKVNVTLATTSKAYLLGTSTTPTSSTQAVTSIADTGVYLGTTAGSLYATKFVGALQGNADTATTATKATQDGDGNTISSTYLKLSGGTMTGTIQGTYSNTHVALAGGGIGDYATLDHKNNINISSWNGVSISNGCSSVGTLDQVTFSVNARTGVTQQRGNAILYSGSGNSPALIFQRGNFTDSTLDWKIYNSSGALMMDRTVAGDTETWQNKFKVDGTGIWYDGTQVSLVGHTHDYAGSTTAGGPANSANVLNKNTRMDYGWDGVNYFNINGTAGNAAKVNDTPTTAWWHIMRFNNYNSSGYYTDLAIPFNATSLYYKRITSGSVQNGGWVKVLDSLNYTSYTYNATASRAANTVLAAPDGSAGTATFRKLVAADLPDSYLPLSGGTMTGAIAYNNATTRLNSLKNLTNDNVGTSATYFLTITNSWGKGGYTSVADAKTVLGLGSAAYTASTAYLASTTKYAASSSVGGPALSATRADYVNVVAGNEIRFYNDNQLKANNQFWIGYSWAQGSHYTPSGGSDTSSTTAPNITKFLMGNCSQGGLASVHAKTFILGNGSSPTHTSKTTTIATAATTTDRTITLPDASGTIAVFPAARTSGQVVVTDGTAGAVKSSGYTIATSVPSGAKFTDEKVTQTAVGSTYTNYRPIVISSANSATKGFSPSTTTDGTFITSSLYCQPSSGMLHANIFEAGKPKTTDGAAKGQLKFFSGNTSDATGTVTLECVNDAARTGDYTVKLPTWNGTIPVFEKLFDGALSTVSLSYSDINEYDLFLITVANNNGTSEQVTVASLWISNVVGVHDMPLIWGGTPSSSGGACNVTSGWIQLSKNSGTTTFSVAHKTNVAQMTSSGWSISSPTYNLYIRKIFGLKTYKRT